MPCIQTKASVKISQEKEKALKEKLGKAIANIPGKSESWLMLEFQDECRMYFKGENEKPMAFVEVKVFGKANRGAYEKMTAAICEILQEELSIAPSETYVKYEEAANWGWNGSNF